MSDHLLTAAKLAVDIIQGRIDYAVRQVLAMPQGEALAVATLTMHECHLRGRAASERGRAFANTLYVLANVPKEDTA